MADESQLGGLTSLMNNNYTGLPRKEDEDLREESIFFPKTDISVINSETDNVRLCIPPKPIKKRFVKQYTDDLKYSTTFIGESETKDVEEADHSDTGSLTKQDLMNKVSIS